MTNGVTIESRLTGVVRSLINDFINNNHKISFYDNTLSKINATLKMSIRDIFHVEKHNDGKNVFHVTLLIKELEAHYSDNFTGLIESPVDYLPQIFFEHYRLMLNQNISRFIPGVYIKLNFIDLTNRQYGK